MGRALSHEAQLIIMDEPSAVLAHDEVANLFRIIRELTAQGIAVIYISHRLEEIREIGDRVTVLKDGRTTAANLPARTTPDPGTGQPDDRPHHRVRLPAARRRRPPADAELLRVDGLTRAGEFADVSLTVHSGEIVGIAGLVGSGRSELLETIFGARRPDAGKVTVDGQAAAAGQRGGGGAGRPRAWRPRSARARRCCSDEPIYRNITLATFARYATAGFTDAGREREAAERVAERWTCAPATCAGRSARCPAATSRRSWSAAGCSAAPSCCCSTSPPAASTSAPGPSSTR